VRRSLFLGPNVDLQRVNEDVRTFQWVLAILRREYTGEGFFRFTPAPVAVQPPIGPKPAPPPRVVSSDEGS